MKSRFLFPYPWRKWGVALFIIGLTLSAVHIVFDEYFSGLHHGQMLAGKADLRELVTDIILLTLICGLLLIAFTKEKVEDEHIAQLRLDSLQWSIYFNYIGLIICIVCITNWHMFVGIAAHFIFTPLLFFIIRFRWVVYQSNRLLHSEE
ncbi:hypothetical protein ACFQZS_17690 [Mucilaginibacter calamicampi]|uniref:Transmembrane protein n=1 Tax=Mucilaginibacter calamicampi TaxID=1302352 RepID=A0ABW2YZT0_9SPHI